MSGPFANAEFYHMHSTLRFPWPLTNGWKQHVVDTWWKRCVARNMFTVLGIAFTGETNT